MSDTPRTDNELRKPENDTGMHNNLTEFCQKLEREIRQLEVTIYDLKTENATLRKERQRDALLGTTAMESDHALITELQEENDELRADNESLVQSNRQLRQSIAVLLDEPVNSL